MVPIGGTTSGEIKMVDVTGLVVQQWSPIHLAIEPQDLSGRIYMNSKSNAGPTLIVSWQ